MQEKYVTDNLTLTKKLTTISVIWSAFMFTGLLLRSKGLPIRLYFGIAASLFVFGIGLTIAILDFAKKRHFYLGILL